MSPRFWCVLKKSNESSDELTVLRTVAPISTAEAKRYMVQEPHSNDPRAATRVQKWRSSTPVELRVVTSESGLNSSPLIHCHATLSIGNATAVVHKMLKFFSSVPCSISDTLPVACKSTATFHLATNSHNSITTEKTSRCNAAHIIEQRLARISVVCTIHIWMVKVGSSKYRTEYNPQAIKGSIEMR